MTMPGDITRRSIEAAHACVRLGLTVSSIEVRTPDQRTWSIDPARRGGYRLFEIDPDGRQGPEEHDAIEGDHWPLDDLMDYLDAVGRPKQPSGQTAPADPTP